MSAGSYVVRFYIANTVSTTNKPGQRVYDICIGDMANPVRVGFDVVAIAGDATGGAACAAGD
jgi:hypothetical protein